ncbi:MAG: DNA polymerase III subunit alpha [Bacilli bacterium]|nr:DNA polymerase III subunit alpha [Bacilli bacterium]
MKYIPLRVKTSYSLLTSLNDINKMILFCKENGIDTLCITDSNMYGVMEFYKECIKNNIKPVIGLELIIDDSIVLLYAKNYSGYQNLTRLVYLKQNEDITIDTLNEYSNDLICVSTRDLSKIYTDFYYGYTNIEDRKNNKSVYINEILCLRKSDKEYLKYLYLIKNNKKIDDNYSFNVHDNCYFDFLENDYDNALELVNKCNIEFKSNKNLNPKYDKDDVKEYLLNLCKKGLYKRFDGKVTKKYYDRLLYELSVIDKMGFNDYFLVVWDYVKYSKQNGILVGPGRGSAAGSLVAYSLGITDVDPLKYDLLFERFLNPERITMPDIDIDFESERREEVVNYVINKYGKKRAVPIITFSTLAGKQVLRDLGRIFNISTSIIDNLTKYIGSNMTLSEALNNDELKTYLNDDYKLKQIYKIALKLEGLKRQISIHAAGVIISGEELDSYIPLEKYDDYYLSGYSMEHLEELGLIKMDFLGLKNLTMILNILNDIGNVNFKDIEIDDKKALSIFNNATTCGIFQFESAGMKRFLSKFRPTSFDDIVAAIALFRPGPSSNIDSYIRRKNGLEKIDYLDKSLENILKPTYGIIIYQEQIMQIANVMAGYSYGEADVLRRAMSKKKKEVLESEKDKFITNSIKRGYKKELATKVYEYILEFANYGFNKAHSVAYSMISLKMAYLKTHYKEYFMSSLLTNAIGNEAKTKEYIDECKKMNINILKPNINISDYKYKKEGNNIRFSLATIRNVGGITCKEIINERDENGKFVDFFDFVKRMYGKSVNKKTLESLIDADVFSDFHYNHKTLHSNIDSAINYGMLLKDLDESLVDKPIINIEEEYSSEEISKKEIDVFGFYLTNHPVTKYKAQYSNIIDANDISRYFDKVVNVVIYVNKVSTILTKKNTNMSFISGVDDTDEIDIVVFPDQYDLISNISKGNILLVTGRIEKRMSKYQLVLEKVKKL